MFTIRWTTATCAIALALPIAAAAQTAEPAGTGTAAHTPLFQPTLEVPRAGGAIRIDGRLDDDGWRTAARVTSFTEYSPRELVAAATPTEAWLAHDDEYLYAAFRIVDDPASLRAALRDRDHVDGDDHVALLLDTYGNNNWCYMIGVNPAGVQFDARLDNGQIADPSLDVLFESEARITDDGWTVELAIPFSSLRFSPAAEQRWRLNLYREHPRESRHLYTWSAIRADAGPLLAQSGSITGIRGVEPGGELEILPGLVASRYAGLENGADPASMQRESPTTALSLGMRYSLRAGITLEATVNPDFSQVESDAAQIDVNTTFALSYPERRPFFQEGADLFQAIRFSQVYTRSVNDPTAAVKLVARQGHWSTAYIGALDEHSPVILPLEDRSGFLSSGRSVSNILRATRAFGDASFAGLLLTDRRLEHHGAGSTLGADAHVQLSDRWALEGQLVLSRTREPDEPGASTGLDGVAFDDDRHSAIFDGETFLGTAAHIALARSARFWNASLAYSEASPTFRADNGFETRNNYRRLHGSTEWKLHPDRGILDRLSFMLSGEQEWNFQGQNKLRSVSPRLGLRFEGQTTIWLRASATDELFRGVRFYGVRTGYFEIISDFSDRVRLFLTGTVGETIGRTATTPFLGDGRNAYLALTLKPIRRFIIEPSIEYARLDAPAGHQGYDGYIARARFDFQLSRALSARLVTQYDDFSGRWDLEPLLTYRLNAYSMLFLGSTQGFQRFHDPFGMQEIERQLFLKFQYLWRP